jgi:hypothetical protein
MAVFPEGSESKKVAVPFTMCANDLAKRIHQTRVSL